MDPIQILTSAKKCAEVFQERLLASANRGIEVSSNETEILETQNARFNLWADNIGGFGNNLSIQE